MGFRFRKTINIIPGVRLNLSNGAPSLSVGPRGRLYPLVAGALMPTWVCRVPA
jgi:hypothetical protein